LIEANAVIQGELAGQLPLVLHIGAEIPAQQRIGVGDGLRRRRRDGPDIPWEYRRYVGDIGLLRRHHVAEPQGMRAVHFIGRVELGAVHLAGARDIGGDIIEGEIA